MNAQAQALAEVLETLRASEAELARRDRGLQNVLLGCGYVVRCDGVCLTFDVDAKTRVASNPRVTSASRAHRFTQRDAETLAAVTKNGAGKVAEAVHIVDAVRQELDGIRKNIAALEAIAA